MTMSEALHRRLKAVGQHLQTVWCTCDDESDSEEGEEEVNFLRPPGGDKQQPSSRHSSTREELYSKDNDFQAETGSMFTPSSKVAGGNLFNTDPIWTADNKRTRQGSAESDNNSGGSPGGSMII